MIIMMVIRNEGEHCEGCRGCTRRPARQIAGRKVCGHCARRVRS